MNANKITKQVNVGWALPTFFYEYTSCILAGNARPTRVTFIHGICGSMRQRY